MTGEEDFSFAFQKLAIPPSSPVIVHASLSVFGEVRGGASAVLNALLNSFETLIMPAFTYKTMVVPEEGPPENGLVYGSYQAANSMAEIFHSDMPVDRLMGVVPESLRRLTGTYRSSHPILSFVGVNALFLLESQTIDEPLTPIRSLMESQGWVLLLGVDHTVSTSIHLGERLAGRKQFVRWALTPDGVMECPHFPGCSDGFNQIVPLLSSMVRQEWVGESSILAVPLMELIGAVKKMVETDPLALLCDRFYCERCQSIRDSLVRTVQ